MRYLVNVLLIAVMVSLLPAIKAPAQVAVPTSQTEVSATQMPTPLSPEAVREMVAGMSDDQVRALLLERLDALAATEEQKEPEIETLGRTLSEVWEAFYTPVLTSLQRLPTLLSSQMQVFANFNTSMESTGTLMLFGLLAIVLAAGYACEVIVVKLLERRKRATALPDDETLKSMLGFLARRLGRELIGLGVFYVAVRTVGEAILTGQQIAVLAPAVRAVILVPRLIAALSRFALAPSQPQFRLLNVDDHWARYLHFHLIGLGVLAGFAMFIINFNRAFGGPEIQTSIGYWLTLAVHVYISTIAWTARDGLVDMMRGRDTDRTGYDEMTARFYPYFAVLVSGSTWVVAMIVAGYGNVALLLKAPHYTTMFWLLMAPLIDTAIRGLVRHLQPPMIGEGAVAERAYKSTKRSLVRIGRVLAFGAIVLIIARAWDIGLASLGSASAGERFAGDFVEFLILCTVGYIIYEAVSLWINRILAKERSAAATSDQAAGEIGGAGGSRLATVLPMLRATAQVAIATIFVLLAVGSLGIDITPLLAGAGILGLAIGFGAQKLVTDIVSGIFFLIDDAFRVGEYVDVGGTMGTVEKISIRSMQLRHHRGNVHTIPYGSVEKVTNFSRDWVIMKLMFTVPFDTDPNKVKKIFKQIGAEMMEDPLYKDDFLEPFKSQGVFQFDDVGIVMRGKFMAKPGTQFTIRKEIYNRVRDKFKENGIEFARREVRVAIPGVDDAHELTPEQREAVGAAATGEVQARIEQKLAEEATVKADKK